MPPEGKRSVLIYALVLAALAPIAHADAWYGLPAADINAWLYVGGRISAGDVPYRDLFDNKLPPIHQVCRAAMATGSPKIALAIADAALATAVGLCVAWFVRRTSGRTAAALAGIVAVVLTGHPRFHGGGGSTENFAGPLLALSMVLACGAPADRPSRSAFAAGLAFALAAGFRPPAILCAAAFVPAAAGLARSGGRPLTRAALGVVAGGLAGTLLILAHPIAHGYLGDTLDACVGWNLKYAAATPSSETGGAYRGAFHAVLFLPLWVCAGIALAGLASSANRTKERWTLAIWWVASVAQCRVGGHDWPHHHVLTFPPLAALTLVGAADVVGMLRRSRAPRVAATAAALALAAWIAQTLVPPLVPPLAESRRVAAGGAEASGCSETVAYLESRVPPEESVFFWTERFTAEANWRLCRPSPSRHFLAPIYSMLGSLDAELAQWRDDVVRARPRYAVVTGIFTPAVTGADGPPADLPPPMTDVVRFLRAGYAVEAAFGRYTILRRRD